MEARPANAGSAGILPASSLPKTRVTRSSVGSKRLVALAAIAISLISLGWAVARKPAWLSGLSASSAASINVDNLDQRLQRAASLTLGDRRGTVIIMDPQTGRIRAVVNPELAFGENLPPGSTIKPFTALTALRSGVIDEDSRTSCGEKYGHEEFHTICSHPRDLPPLNPTDAIAYSCNYYFGKVGERLTEASFSATLNEFGFGRPSGINVARESQGQLSHEAWRTQNAIGEGDYIRSTPIQLLDAYTALVNGGHLFTPRIAGAAGFVPEVRTNLTINDEYRSLILKGMRGAVRYGTAETAKLYSLPTYVFGKTGTATEINGYRSQGWFVGFASNLDEHAADETELAPKNVKLAVLIFVAKAHGSEAAELSRPIFAEFAQAQSEDLNRSTIRVTSSSSEDSSSSSSEASGNSSSEISNFRSQIGRSEGRQQVRVHLVRENITRTIPLEDYVRGVVAAEGSTEREPEALKALAIASRTFVRKNLGRHERDGYDFCTTTHCQRFRDLASDSADVSAAVSEAVEETKGQVLRDSNDQLADSYFSASCGGATANLTTLWGGSAPPYLKGVRDESCASEPHHSWTDVISQAQLSKALESDQRTNVGGRLVNASVLRTDATGRAELIQIEGSRRITVKGWDFKIIVGRALGWNLLKSSRFEIARSGSNFVFHGSGFGHGLGLCQEGAHVMARRGASYRQILDKYFPSVRIANENIPSADLMWGQKPDPKSPMSNDQCPTSVTEPAFHVGRETLDIGLWTLASPRHTVASEDFRINYPDRVSRGDAEGLLSFLQSTRQSLVARANAAGVRAQLPLLEIFINETTGDFVGRTGQPIWAAAATRGNQIEIQPFETLKRRRILETTLRHELVHTLVEVVGHGRAPRWLAEGFALHLAGEGLLITRYQSRQHFSTAEIDKQLGYGKSTVTENEMRAAYAAAYSEVKRLIKNEGEARVWRRVAKS
jgi:SpoIID/LytB domain protein